MVWDGASHKWEQDQWNGIETILQPALWAVVEVEDQNPHQVHDEGQDEQVANEALLLVDLALSASTQLLNGLCGERGRGRGREGEGEGERGREEGERGTEFIQNNSQMAVGDIYIVQAIQQLAAVLWFLQNRVSQTYSSEQRTSQ